MGIKYDLFGRGSVYAFDVCGMYFSDIDTMTKKTDDRLGHLATEATICSTYLCMECQRGDLYLILTNGDISTDFIGSWDIISLCYGVSAHSTCYYYCQVSSGCRCVYLPNFLPAILRFIRPIRSQRHSVALSQDLTFDYRVAQASIFIETTAYVLTLIAPSSNEVLFVVFTSLSSFTAGVNPAIHSLAVTYLFAFHNDANVGRMFGGMSMLQAISHTLQVSKVSSLVYDIYHLPMLVPAHIIRCGI